MLCASAEQVQELRSAESGLPQNGAESAPDDLAVQRNDHDSAVRVAELRVAALGRAVLEARSFERLDDLLAGNLRKGWAHAGMRISIGVTSGCSKEAGTSSSSKYSSNASRRLASASSTVSPGWRPRSPDSGRRTTRRPSRRRRSRCERCPCAECRPEESEVGPCGGRAHALQVDRSSRVTIEDGGR